MRVFEILSEILRCLQNGHPSEEPNALMQVLGTGKNREVRRNGSMNAADRLTHRDYQLSSKSRIMAAHIGRAPSLSAGVGRLSRAPETWGRI